MVDKLLISSRHRSEFRLHGNEGKIVQIQVLEVHSATDIFTSEQVALDLEITDFHTRKNLQFATIPDLSKNACN